MWDIDRQGGIVMKLKKIYAVLLVFSLVMGSLACPIGVKRVQAAEQDTGTYVGLDAEYHTQEEIREYYKNHPVKNMEAEFSTKPSVTQPYALGELTEETKQDALNMLNLYRYIAGVPMVSITEKAQNHAQAAALVTAINRSVSHVADQPEGMSEDMYALAVYGTFNSNLAAGGNQLCANLIRYMLETNGDPDFGHRRQLLEYYYKEAGFGIAQSVSGGYYSATFVDANLKEDKIIAYPGQNQPLEYFGPGYAWTVIVPEKVDKAKINVRLTDMKTGEIWNFNGNTGYLRLDISSGSTCVIFSPTEIDYRDGDKYKVEITGISKPISYEVNLFTLQDPVPLESISSDIAAYYPYEGETSYTCHINYEPENATNKIVKWTSSDPDIAEPKWNGTGVCKVIAKKPGTAVFTATAEDGGHTAYIEIFVRPRAESITLQVTDITIGVGQSFELYGKTFPAESSDSVCYKYNYDTNIIKTENTSYGGRIKVTGKAVGQTTITAYPYSNPDITTTCRINVVEPVYTQEFTLDQTEIELIKGETVKLNTMFFPSNITCQQVKWSVDDINIASVKDGEVKATGNYLGETMITAKAMDGSDKEAKCKVTVYGKYAKREAPWMISCSPDTVTLGKVENCEYSMDKVNWQDSNVFTGLEAEHEYTFYIRQKAYRYMKASDASEGLVVKTTEIISPKECSHSNTVVRNVKEAMCREAGYSGDTYCTECGKKTASGKIIPAAGHDYKGKVTKVPTFMIDGERTYTCIRCGDSYTEKIPRQSVATFIPECEHDHTNVKNESQATCMESGYSGDIYCTECGSITVTGSAIEALGHDYISEVTKEPAATDEGIRTFTCKRCGDSYTETIPKTEANKATPLPTASVGNIPTVAPIPTASVGNIPTAVPNEDNTGESLKTETPAAPKNTPVATIEASSVPQATIAASFLPQATPIATAGVSTTPPADVPSQTPTALPAVVKGTKITVGNSTYTVTDVAKKTVSFSGLAKKTEKKVTIPATITYNGQTYKVTAIEDSAFSKNKTVTTVTIGKNVTSIGAKAFNQCTKLTKITIPSKVNKIGKQAFYGCSKLKSITITTTKLTTKNVGSQAFKEIAKKAVIKVPKSKKKAYWRMLKTKGIDSKSTVK